MMPEILPWQSAIWQHLSASIVSRRIPQAILLSGTAGLGKRRLADVYAAALLCQSPLSSGLACGICSACKLFLANTHSDYLLIEPDEPGKAIGIDKVRQLTVKLALKPQFSAYRVVIFQPADSLNNHSANAFLKCLEEPGERTAFILISQQPAKLPATIRSRCQKFHCTSPDKQLAEQWLLQQGVTQDAALLLKMSQGAPLLAKSYADQQLIALKVEFFQAWLQVAEGKQSFLAVAEHWQKQDRVDLAVLLLWLISAIKDILKLAYQLDPAEIDNPDFKKPLQALAQRLELKAVFNYYDKLLTSRSLLATQVNKQLLLERLIIDWYELNSPCI